MTPSMSAVPTIPLAEIRDAQDLRVYARRLEDLPCAPSSRLPVNKLRAPIDVVADLHRRVSAFMAGRMGWLLPAHHALMLSEAEAWPAIDMMQLEHPVRLKDRGVAAKVRRFWLGKSTPVELQAAASTAFWICRIAEDAADGVLNMVEDQEPAEREMARDGGREARPDVG